MSIVLVRHGETAGNFARVLQRPEIPLNETGRAQAELLGARLSRLGAVGLLTSDHPRAAMTAAAIARHTGLPAVESELLRERNMGDWRGRPYAEFTAFHPLSPEVNPPNGESWDVFHARVREAFAWVLAQHRGTLIVVTHGLVLRSLFERVLAHAVPAGGFANGSISILPAEPPHTPNLMNCVRHLEAASSGSEL